MHQSEKPMSIDLVQFLTPVDEHRLECVDERTNTEHITNGVKIPGGIYGILDAIKALTGASEKEARERVVKADFPIWAHVDEHHHEKGCGYAKLVETNPTSVSAIEAVSASERADWVKQQGGTILHYIGEHKPTHAVINRKTNTSIDPEKAGKQEIGPFDCDVWAVGTYAKKLGIDPEKMKNHIEKVYRQTVTALSGITQFHEIR